MNYLLIFSMVVIGFLTLFSFYGSYMNLIIKKPAQKRRGIILLFWGLVGVYNLIYLIIEFYL
jgi:hypothetical protein